MTQDKHWRILQSHLVFDHPWYKVRRDQVQLPNGQILSDYYLGLLPDVALVMPVTPDNHVIFVRQYRHAAATVMIELPAGNFDPQVESAAAAALRELQEETGYTAEHLIPLGITYDNPVKTTGRTFLFLAPNAYLASTPNPDATEDIDIVTMPLNQVAGKIQTGEIQVNGTISALYLGLAYLQNTPPTPKP